MNYIFFSFDKYNMQSGEVVQNIQFNSEIADVLANRRVVVVAFREKLAAFDACNLEARFTVTNCYPSPGVHANPIALGDRWLAYADQRLVGLHRCILILFYIFSIGMQNNHHVITKFIPRSFFDSLGLRVVWKRMAVNQLPHGESMLGASWRKEFPKYIQTSFLLRLQPHLTNPFPLLLLPREGIRIFHRGQGALTLLDQVDLGP